MERGMQALIANISGVAPASINAAVRGKRGLGKKSAIAIGRSLGVDPAHLVLASPKELDIILSNAIKKRGLFGRQP